MILIWSAIATIFIIVTALLYLAYRTIERLDSRQDELDQEIVRLKHELTIVSSAAIGVGKHLISVEKKLANNTEKQQQLEMTTVDYLPYKQAVSLVENGASASQLMEDCGLSEAEASLMTLVKNSSTSC